MLGVGGLMGIRIATSCMLGAFINFAVLAPLMIQHGDIKAYTDSAGVLVPISRGEIVNQWSLWWGVAMMVVGSMVSLFARPEIFVNAFRSMRKRERTGPDVLGHIELPLWLSFVGVPVFSVLGAAATHYFFGVPWLLAFVSLPLIFLLTVICTNSMALTSWTPTGALSKITQFSMGAIDRANPASNLIPAGMTAEIASNAANLLSDIKPGYMLGAKPRQQAIGHVIGIFAGSLCATPLFFLLFLPPDANGVRSVSTMVSDQFAMPAALQWKGVAELIARGLSALPQSAVIAMSLAAVAAVVFEVLRIRTRERFPVSAVSVGLGVVLPPESCLAMWMGALLFWWMGRKKPAPGTRAHDFWVEGCEPICAGLISGAALVGIGNAIVNVLICARCPEGDWNRVLGTMACALLLLDPVSETLDHGTARPAVRCRPSVTEVSGQRIATLGAAERIDEQVEQLRLGGHVELCVAVFGMQLDGFRRDAQPFGDRLGRVPAQQQLDDLGFAIGQEVVTEKLERGVELGIDRTADDGIVWRPVTPHDSGEQRFEIQQTTVLRGADA